MFRPKQAVSAELANFCPTFQYEVNCQNSLLWPKQAILAEKVIRPKFRLFRGPCFGFGVSAKNLFRLTTRRWASYDSYRREKLKNPPARMIIERRVARWVADSALFKAVDVIGPAMPANALLSHGLPSNSALP